MEYVALNDRIKPVYGDHQTPGIGRALNCLAAYFGVNKWFTDNVTFKESKIFLEGKHIGNYVWKGNTPVFEWVKPVRQIQKVTQVIGDLIPMHQNHADCFIEGDAAEKLFRFCKESEFPWEKRVSDEYVNFDTLGIFVSYYDNGLRIHNFDSSGTIVQLLDHINKHFKI